MGKPSRYSAEVRERAVRMVREHENEHTSQWAAITSIAEKIGCSGETLRNWVRQAERDAGLRPGLTTDVPAAARTRPAHDSPAEHIHHHRQVEKTRPGGHVHDVRHPQLIRSLGYKRPIHQIRCRTSPRITPRCHATLAAGHSHYARRLHQPCHPLAVHPPTLVAQLSVNHGRVVSLPRCLLDETM